MDENIDYSEFRLITDRIQEKHKDKLNFVRYGKFYIIKINSHILNDKNMVDYMGLLHDDGLEFNAIHSPGREVYLCSDTMTTYKKLGQLMVSDLQNSLIQGLDFKHDEVSGYIHIKNHDGSVLMTGILSHQIDALFDFGSFDYTFVKNQYRTDQVYLNITLPQKY